MPLDAATQATIDGQQAFAMVGTVMWTMLRTGAMLMATPIIGTTALSKRVRVILAAALAMAIAPMLPPAPSIFVWNAATVLSVAREILLGAAIGFMLRLAFEAGALAGELISQGTGLAFAQMADPLRGVNSGVISTWFYLVFGLLFFAFNGHLALITTLVDSYRAMPIGHALPDAQQFLSQAPTLFGAMLRGAAGLALPMMMAMLAVNLAFGVLARAAPALNPIQLGLPTALLLGLLLLTLLTGEMGPPVQRLFESAFEAGHRLTAPP